MENKKSNLTTTKKSEVALGGAAALQVSVVKELEQTADELGTKFTPYGKSCMVNAIGGLVAIIKQQGIPMSKIDSTLLKLQIQNIGYTELNYATLPSEVYIDLRRNYKKDDSGNDASTYSVTIKPQGVGNEKLVRKYGVGIVKGTGLHSAWLVREGDEFEYPYFDGLKMTPPKWKPKSYDKKVIMVVYPVQKIDGDVEYLIATREGIKPNLIAQIRQNTLYSFKKDKYTVDEDARNAFYERVNTELEKLTVDEILANPEWRSYLTPTYTSGGSVESMVIRKMKNNALKNYPKEYDNSAIRDAVENMFEDNDDSLKINKKEDIIDAVENDINAPVDENAPQDFEVSDDGVVEETEETTETPVENETKKEERQDEENPDW